MLTKNSFKIRITETLSRDIEVTAENYDIAESIVSDLYDNEEIILTDADYVETLFEEIKDQEEPLWL